MELTHDSQTNTLRLTPSLPDSPATARTTSLASVLDIGEAGRLIGVEFPAVEPDLALWLRDSAATTYITHTADRAYIQITAADTTNARSADIDLIAEYDSNNHLVAIAIPRRGHGYEISYPSGNQ